MKKITTLIILLAVALTMTGCCLKHDWQEATCTAPKTCAKCGETDGEKSEHQWIPATCLAPQTCSVCGGTEGEALEHILTKANYQQAASCDVCGEIVGEPLKAGFEMLGIECFTELDKPYEYVTDCNDAPVKTKGTITFTDFKTFESDETHEAVEGYEWQTITATMIFDDMNNAMHGSSYTQGYCNYYRVHENTQDVNFNGIDYPKFELITEKPIDGEWSGTTAETASIKTVYKFYILAPKGYDGTVLFFCDNQTRALIMAGKPIEECINENTLFFRINAN